MRLKYWFIAVSAMLLGACGYDKLEIGPEENDGDRTLPNLRIGDLRGFYKGKPLRVNRNIVVAGYVTATDRSRNFYRTFLIEDETGAVEIRAGLYDLHNIYHEGQRVVVRAEGLTLGADREVMQLGLAAPAGSSWQTGYFGHRLVMDRYISRDSVVRVPDPLPVGLSGLSCDLCGRLVRIENLTADTPGESWGGGLSSVGTPQTGYRCFRDADGDSIYVETSGYASFADHAVPGGELSVTGILFRGKRFGNDCYMLKFREENDVETSRD